MLSWKIEKIRYAPDKLTITISDPNTGEQKEIHLTLEEYQGSLSAVARLGNEIIWFAKIQNKHFKLPE